jgi:hypothetical protein
VDTAQPQRKQPMEPWGNAGRSGPLARPVSHRAPRGRRTAGNPRRHPTAWPSNLPGACDTEHFGDSPTRVVETVGQAVCLLPRHIRGLSKRGCDRHGFDQTEASQGV